MTMAPINRQKTRIELKGSECANCRSQFPEEGTWPPENDENLKPPNSKITNFVIDVNDEEFGIEVSEALIEIYRLQWVDEVESVEAEELKSKLILCYDCGVIFAQLCKYYYDFNFLRKADAVITESQQRIEDMLEKLKEQEQKESIQGCKANETSPVEDESDVEIINEVNGRKTLVNNKEHVFTSDPALNPILTTLLETPVPPNSVQNAGCVQMCGAAKQQEPPMSVSEIQQTPPPTSFGTIGSVSQNIFSSPSIYSSMSVSQAGFMTQGQVQGQPLTFSQVPMPMSNSSDCIISLQQAEHAILTVPTIIQVDSNYISSNFTMTPFAFPAGVQLGAGGLLTQTDPSQMVTANPNAVHTSSSLRHLDLDQHVRNQFEPQSQQIQVQDMLQAECGNNLGSQLPDNWPEKACRLDSETQTNEYVSLSDQQVSIPDQIRSQMEAHRRNRQLEIETESMKLDGEGRGRDQSQRPNFDLFKCEECGDGFSTRRALSLHRIHEHSQESGEKCFVCSKVFTSKKNLNIHLGSAHKTCEPLGKYIPEAFPMKCVDCNEMCNNFVELHEHRMKAHPVDEPFQCHICRLVLNSAGSYHSHIKLHEMQAVDCKFCSEKFPSDSELGRHITACHQFKKVRIEKMSAKSVKNSRVQSPALQSNVSLQPLPNLQSPGNLQQVNCGNKKKAKKQSKPSSKTKTKSLKKSVPKSPTGRNSRYSVSIEKQRIYFRCVDCQEVFHTSAALGDHRGTLHPQEDAFKCHICFKVVSRANSLNDHVRRHTGLRPYRCRMCDNSFKTAGDARQHHFAVHGINGEKQSKTPTVGDHIVDSSMEQEYQPGEDGGEDRYYYQDDEEDSDSISFPVTSLIEVNLSDTGSDSFNMEEVELFD